MSNLKLQVLAWRTVSWSSVNERVRQTQRRIYKASKSGNYKRMYWIQRRLIGSLWGKLFAVRQVTTLNKGRNTAGVDGQGILTDAQKLSMARNLKLNGKASAIRRVWIPKPGKTEKRDLGIPTMQDRAKQALAKLALEPQWEAIFEPNSYGFRPARGCHDAIEAIFLALHHKVPKYVYDADIRKCFDRIDHKSLIGKLNTFPEMEEQISAWLRADIMEGYANNPKTILSPQLGTPQGGVISPLLANIALHGLENHIKNFVDNLRMLPHPGANRGSVARRKAVSIIRYADDFVIIHQNREILELCTKETEKWLGTIGLEISSEKSALRDGRTGFCFLGYQIIQVRKDGDYKVKISPSSIKQQQFLEKVGNTIHLQKAASSYQLIKSLRPQIIGWANYYRFCECKDTFQKLTNSIFQKIRAWVFRRDTRHGRQEVKEKYFPTGRTWTFKGVAHKDNWTLFGKSKGPTGVTREIFLPHIVWISSEKFVKIKGDHSPFDGDYIYWTARSPKHNGLNTTMTALLKSQKFRCTHCKKLFTVMDTNLEIDHVIPLHKGGLKKCSNLQLLHKNCHISKTLLDDSFKSIAGAG